MEQVTLPSFSENIEDIYFLANSPYTLYRLMRQDIGVVNCAQQNNAQDLMTAFNILAEQPLNTTAEIAQVYAIFIALTLKNGDEVTEFFKKSLAIKFEWFAQIAQYYLTNTPIVYSVVAPMYEEQKSSYTETPSIISPPYPTVTYKP